MFLDEPSTGLDVEARQALWDGIRTFSDEGGTVMLTSHYADSDRLVRDLVDADLPFCDLEVRPTSLEEAFLTLTAA